MFRVLNQRWLVLLQERELVSPMNIEKRPPHQNWLQSFLHGCMQKLGMRPAE
jgi:hypothetical protein